MIVPFPPGGVADTVARPVAEALSRELKQPVVVENSAGAGGALGIGVAVARAAPTATRCCSACRRSRSCPRPTSSSTASPPTSSSQFKPIARFTADPTVLVVRADAPWKTLAEFVADAKRKPGAYNYGSSGNYGTMHVPMEMLKAQAGFRMTHIPYTGAGPAVIALLGGQVDALASGPSTVVQQIQAGKLRALAHWGEQPLAALPERAEPRSSSAIRCSSRSGRRCSCRPARPTTSSRRLRAASAKAAADPAVRAGDRQGRQPDRVPRRAGVPDLLERRCAR